MDELSHVGMTNCWICSEGAEILLDRRMKKSLKANMGSAPNIVCSDCESKSKDNDGIWLISIKDDEELTYVEGEIWNPYRTGGLVLIKKQALRDIFQSCDIPKETLKLIDKNIYFYLRDSEWNAFGLPKIGGNDE